MDLRTYYWRQRVVGRFVRNALGAIRPRQSRFFAIGNAGDILAKPILRQRYGIHTRIRTRRTGGHRLLVIGSLAHLMQPGDVVAGIGWKGGPLPPNLATSVRVLGVRGPITLERLQADGFDTSTVRFVGDPGLLIADLVGIDREEQAPSGNAIFIPHYRERWMYRSGLPAGVDLVDIDADPLTIARRILDAQAVYSSSLHGIVFAHALKRPAVLVRPQSDEPLIKYEDHYAAVGLKMPKPLGHITGARPSVVPTSPASIRVTSSDFTFPSADELIDWGVAH